MDTEKKYPVGSPVRVTVQGLHVSGKVAIVERHGSGTELRYGQNYFLRGVKQGWFGDGIEPATDFRAGDRVRIRQDCPTSEFRGRVEELKARSAASGAWTFSPILLWPRGGEACVNEAYLEHAGYDAVLTTSTEEKKEEPPVEEKKPVEKKLAPGMKVRVKKPVGEGCGWVSPMDKFDGQVREILGAGGDTSCSTLVCGEGYKFHHDWLTPVDEAPSQPATSIPEPVKPLGSWSWTESCGWSLSGSALGGKPTSTTPVVASPCTGEAISALREELRIVREERDDQARQARDWRDIAETRDRATDEQLRRANENMTKWLDTQRERNEARGKLALEEEKSKRLEAQLSRLTEALDERPGFLSSIASKGRTGCEYLLAFFFVLGFCIYLPCLASKEAVVSLWGWVKGKATRAGQWWRGQLKRSFFLGRVDRPGFDFMGLLALCGMTVFFGHGASQVAQFAYCEHVWWRPAAEANRISVPSPEHGDKLVNLWLEATRNKPSTSVKTQEGRWF